MIRSAEMTSGTLPGGSPVERQQAANTFDSLKGKLAELMAEMDKLSGAARG